MLARKINLKCKITHLRVSLKSHMHSGGKTVPIDNIGLLFLEFAVFIFEQEHRILMRTNK